MTLKTKVIAINAFQRTVIPWDMVETVLNQSRHGTGNIKRYSMQNVIEAQPLYDLQCNLKRATNEHVEEEIKVVDQFLRSSFNCSDVREYVDCTTKELTAALENAMMDNPTHLVLYINPIVSVGFDILLNINEKDKITIQKRIGMSPDWRNTSKETALNRDVSNLHLFPNIFTDILHPACGVSTAREISPMVLVIWDSSLGNSLPGRNLNSLQFFPVEQGSSAELYAMIQMLSQLNEILDEAASLATPGQQFRIDLVDLYTALANHCNDCKYNITFSISSKFELALCRQCKFICNALLFQVKPLSMCNYAQAPRPSLHVSLADRFQVPFNPNPDLENQIVGLAVYIELRRWTTNIDDSLADWLAIRSQTKQFVTRIGFLWDKSTTSNWINSDALDKSTLMERLDSIIKHSCKMASQKKLRSMAIAVTSKFGNSLEIKTNGLSEGQTCLYTEIIKMVEAHPYVTNLLLLSHHSSGNYLIHSAIPGSKHNKLQKLPILPVIKKQSTEYICMRLVRNATVIKGTIFLLFLIYPQRHEAVCGYFSLVSQNIVASSPCSAAHPRKTILHPSRCFSG